MLFHAALWPFAAATVLDFDDGSKFEAFNVVAGSKAGGRLPSWRVPMRHCDDAACRTYKEVDGFFVGEPWSETKATRVIDRGKGLAVAGSSRLYLAAPLPGGLAPAQWMDVQYQHFHLVGKSLSFTIDLSNVACGCNAALYLVQMSVPSDKDAQYCDIQGFDSDEFEPCTELDVIEGNHKALQATLHTSQGTGDDGRCNQDGCAGNWGRYDDETAEAYGMPATKGFTKHTIDSSEPFRVHASFGHKRINWYTDSGAAFEVRAAAFSPARLDASSEAPTPTPHIV